MSGKLWEKNGYVAVPVTQEHIDRSLERNSSHCMTAMALAEAIPDARRIAVDLQTIRFTYKGLRYVFLTPHVCQDNIISFDQGERTKIRPFELKMRPAQISKAGKKRRQCPTDRELRGTGLTVAEEQPHLDRPLESGISNDRVVAETRQMKAPPQRLTASGERNLDPDRSDGLAPAKHDGVAAPQPKRANKRKVSTAHKGAIPTTLGGKLPPVSVLARPEFGLRVLRK
jgi:hypothetical protein